MKMYSVDPKVLEECLAGDIEWGYEGAWGFPDEYDLDFVFSLPEELHIQTTYIGGDEEAPEFSFIDINTCAERDQFIEWMGSMLLKYGEITEFSMNMNTYVHLNKLVPDCFSVGELFGVTTFVDEELEDYVIGWRYNQ